jgi:hypothetical protein
MNNLNGEKKITGLRLKEIKGLLEKFNWWCIVKILFLLFIIGIELYELIGLMIFRN